MLIVYTDVFDSKSVQRHLNVCRSFFSDKDHPMSDHERIKALYRRLTEERRRVIETAAESGLVPPRNLLSYLADLDGATLAIESVLDQWLDEREPTRAQQSFERSHTS